MFQDTMSPGEARAELVRLKLGMWPTALELLEAFVSSPRTDELTAQSDWIDTPEFGYMAGWLGLIYCRTTLGGTGTPLIAMVGICQGRLPLPTPGHGAWEPRSSVNPVRPLIEVFREATWGTSRIDDLRTHLPRRSSVQHHGWVDVTYDMVPRTSVLEALRSPSAEFVTGARVGFRMGDQVIWFGDPEQGGSDSVHFPDDPAAAQRARENLAVLSRIADHPFVKRLVPHGEGIVELRIRAARR